MSGKETKDSKGRKKERKKERKEGRKETVSRGKRPAAEGAETDAGADAQTYGQSSRRNGINSRSDLSHHRTCRSAYGGSLINL